MNTEFWYINLIEMKKPSTRGIKLFKIRSDRKLLSQWNRYYTFDTLLFSFDTLLQIISTLSVIHFI